MVERLIGLPANVLYKAWTEQIDVWFAAPGSALMKGEVNTAFFFETEYKFETATKAERHPHYGRFLRLQPDQLVEITWVTGTRGTKGAETVVTIELIPQEKGTLLRLTHAGFPDGESKNGHEKAWPMVLEQLEKKIKEI
jgi:uncharacterized protein YndB with AHSA1/START domain